VPCGLLGGLPKALLAPSQIETNSARRYFVYLFFPCGSAEPFPSIEGYVLKEVSKLREINDSISAVSMYSSFFKILAEGEGD
jgi:hypothetical protein